MDVGKAILVSAVLVSGVVLVGMNQAGSAQDQDTNQALPRYQIVTGAYGLAWRLNTITGEVIACFARDDTRDGKKCYTVPHVISEGDFEYLSPSDRHK